MNRVLAIAVLFVGAGGLLPAAPVPPDAGKPPFYYPTRIGTKWTYQEKGGTEHGEIITASTENAVPVRSAKRGPMAVHSTASTPCCCAHARIAWVSRPPPLLVLLDEPESGDRREPDELLRLLRVYRPPTRRPCRT